MHLRAGEVVAAAVRGSPRYSAIIYDRGKIVRFDVTPHPTAGCLSRQATEAFPWDTAQRYLLRDRDASYEQHFRRQVHGDH